MARLGWSSLRPVQELAGAALLDGHNAVVLAPTAGGKTEASIFPALSQLVDDEPKGVGVLYVAPLRALLNNQSDRLGTYAEMVGLRRFVWHGDTTSTERKKFLREPAPLLMTTPESLEVMLMSRHVDAGVLFRDLRTVIVDEVHSFPGEDRGAHLMSVLERLAELSRHDVQRVGLSATVGNPATILEWLQGTSERPGTVVDPPPVPQPREIQVVERDDVQALARLASQQARGAKSLFFCQSRSTSETVADEMRRQLDTVYVHHSSVAREERQLAEEMFHEGGDACIVCTSTLELGIDVGDLDRVLQAGAPSTVSSFMQRMGRTGRREGQIANTSFFCGRTEEVLQAIALVELAKQRWVESVEVDRRCWPVLVHQLLAMALAEDGVTQSSAWQRLHRVPNFAGITQAEFNRLIEWLVRDRALERMDGRLLLGPTAEKKFGRHNFMELFAVFSSPQTYTVQDLDGRVYGTLEQAFVDRLVHDISTFLLGGRAWAVMKVQHEDKRVFVRRAPKGREPGWGSFLPQFLGFEVCQQILVALTSETDHPYLDAQAAEGLDRQREEMSLFLGSDGGVEFEGGDLTWWTFAGGRINATLRAAISASTGYGWKIVTDNFFLRIEPGKRDEVNLAKFSEAVRALHDLELWQNEALWREVAATLPNYRLSKFQPLLPPWVQREMVAGALLDLRGAYLWLVGSEGGGVERLLARQQLGGERPDSGRPAVEVREVADLPRVPTGTGLERSEDWELPREETSDLPVLQREQSRRLVHVVSEAQLERAASEIIEHRRVGLDVETTLDRGQLCLVQLATRDATYLVDPIAIGDLSALGEVLASERITKSIHNADFERGVLGAHGFELNGVYDTLEASREREPDARGGHSLQKVVERVFGKFLNKREQTSDWVCRPLSDEQIDYAALDAEIVLTLAQRWDPGA